MTDIYAFGHVVHTLAFALKHYRRRGYMTSRKYINDQIAMLQDKHRLSIEEVAKIVYTDQTALNAFKKMWATPGWILNELDELLVEMTLSEAHDEDHP